MRVVIAPDKFAGTMTALEAGRAIADGWHQVRPGDEIRVVPMADGGLGSIDVIRGARPNSRVQSTQVTGPHGRPVTARWLEMEDGSAFVEAAEACGLHLLSPQERDPLVTTSRGVGELMTAASLSCRGPIVVGLGGSGVVDGGAGALSALGFEILDRHGAAIQDGGGGLAGSWSIRAAKSYQIEEVVVASDVDSPLAAAATVFAAQKGATTGTVQALFDGLDIFADVVERDLPGGPWRQCPGAGASGGLGFALMAAFRARVMHGAFVVGQMVALPDALRWADVVITGEGSLDEQSLAGKTPVYVAREAKGHGCRIFAVAGRCSDGMAKLFGGVEELGHSGLIAPHASVTEAGGALAMSLDGPVHSEGGGQP